MLEMMSGKFDSSTPKGSDTASWDAFRIAEKLNDLQLVGELLDYLTDRQSNHRKYAAVVLGYIAKNTGSKELVNQLVAILPVLEKDESALYNTLMAIVESGVQIDYNPKNVLYYITDDRGLIRNAAIRAVGHFVFNKENIRTALQSVVESHYDEYDLKYAHESLKKITAI